MEIQQANQQLAQLNQELERETRRFALIPPTGEERIQWDDIKRRLKDQQKLVCELELESLRQDQRRRFGEEPSTPEAEMALLERLRPMAEEVRDKGLTVEVGASPQQRILWSWVLADEDVELIKNFETSLEEYFSKQDRKIPIHGLRTTPEFKRLEEVYDE